MPDPGSEYRDARRNVDDSRALNEARTFRDLAGHLWRLLGLVDGDRNWKWQRIALLAVSAFVILLIVSLTIGRDRGGSQPEADVATPSASTPSDAVGAPDDDVDEPAAPVADAGPVLFSGTIMTENGWFTIVVAEDGSVSGTLDVSMQVENGTVVQTGSFTGSIDEANVVTCAGAFEGISTDLEGREFPHSGTVSVRAVPTSEDLSAWEVSADGEPGDPIVLPANAR